MRVIGLAVVLAVGLALGPLGPAAAPPEKAGLREAEAAARALWEAAKALGLTIPQSLLLGVDQVIDP
jgi:hypothetical protein